MKLSTKTIAVLKNFATINNSMLFQEGKEQHTISPTKNIYASATLEEEFPSEFGIYDVSEFLNTLSLFDEPELHFQDKHLIITDGKTRCRYNFSPKNVIIYPTQTPNMPDFDVEFNLAEENLAKIQKAAAVMDLPDVCVTLKDTTLTLEASDTQNDATNTYDIEVGDHTNDTDKVNFVFRTENLKMLPGEYDVKITNPAGHFVGSDIEYYIALERSSTFEGGE